VKVSGSGVSRQPASQGCLRQRAFGELHEHFTGFFFTGSNHNTIEFEKDEGQDEAGALIAVDKRMVPDDAKGIRRGQPGQAGGRCGLSKAMPRASQR
jgi:hypothetical protein